MDWTWAAIIAVVVNLIGWAYFFGCLRTTVKSNSSRLKRIEKILDYQFNGGPPPEGWGGKKSKKRR